MEGNPARQKRAESECGGGGGGGGTKKDRAERGVRRTEKEKSQMAGDASMPILSNRRPKNGI